MLCLKRSEGQWVEITHKSGDVIRIRVCDIKTRESGRRINLIFSDDERNFEISRPERAKEQPVKIY